MLRLLDGVREIEEERETERQRERGGKRERETERGRERELGMEAVKTTNISKNQRMRGRKIMATSFTILMRNFASLSFQKIKSTH